MPQDPVTSVPAPPPPPPTLPVAQEAVNVAAIRAVRSELSRQITSATNRRNELAERLRNAEPEERPGLEARIQALDERIIQLERDLAETGRQLTANPAALTTATRDPGPIGGFSSGQATAISIVFTIFVLAPLALAAARLMWKRARIPARVPLPPETVQRLERIEHSVDAIAIEVERVTEGQRFLTRLLTDNRQPPALAAPERGRDLLHAETIHTPGKGSG